MKSWQSGETGSGPRETHRSPTSHIGGWKCTRYSGQPQPSTQQRISSARLIQTIPKWNGCLLRCCHSVKGTSILPIASSILMFRNDSERAPVTEQTSAAFYPRENGNGTVDSICLVCFRTVGPAVSELQLSEFEREHVCESRYTPAAPLSQTVGSVHTGRTI